MTRSQILMEATLEFLKEMELLMEEDDGTVFQLQHIEQMEYLTDLLKEEGYE